MEDVATFALMRMLGPAFAGLAISVMLWAPLVLYVLARWRQHREPATDPQHGLKFALHYFGTIALQVALASVALLLSTVVSSGSWEDRSDAYRMAFGALIPAAAVLAGYIVLLRRSNDPRYPGLRRLFTGFNLIATGGVAFIALIIGFQLLFARGSTNGSGRVAAVVILVYTAASALLARQLVRLAIPTTGTGTGGTGWAETTPTTTAAMAPSPAVAEPATGLPALGGGAFPPIEPRH